MSKYPKITDTDFYNKINNEFNQYKIPNSKKTLKQICFPEKYEFQIPQMFLSKFINPETPYTGILIYHRIGAGKTCTAINICENYKNDSNVIVVLPASLIGNFRTELRSLCTGDKYLKKSERKLLQTLEPSSKKYKEIIEKSDERIDKYYNIYSYNKFIDMLKNKEINLANTLLVIDEVHNMISATGTYYELLYKAVKSAPASFRMVILTATPIVDKPVEIALTMNLLIRSKEKIPTGQSFAETFMDISYSKTGPVYKVKNMDMLKEFIKGYVSYYRGAPPYVFPQSNIKYVRVKMSDKQYKLYKNIIAKESKSVKVDDYVNVDISNSFFIGTRMVSNFVYPNSKFGLKGYDSLKESDYTLEQIAELSPKSLKILRKIKKCKGTVFVYSNFREYGGIKSFMAVLQHHGFKNYETDGPGKNRFAVWSGEQTKETKEEIKAVFNNINNVDGSKIKIILGSPSIKEGVNLLRVQEVHILEPYWNTSRLDQIIGRAIRFCSHKDVPIENQVVNVYIYLSVHPNIKLSVDEYIMKMAFVKQQINKQFELALKEAAVDCHLFKSANVYHDEEDIICVK